MKIKASKNILIALYLITLLLTGFLYKDSFKAYFFQDDWFSLRISQISDIGGFLNFFIPRTDVIYYRPLGMQVPFFLLQQIFGITSVPFHFLIFFTHALNIVLVYAVAFFILRTQLKAALLAFLYAISAVHYTLFYWSATYAFVLGPAFFFLSFLLFLRFLKNQQINYYIISIIIFILGLLTNELVVTLPIIISLFLFLERKFGKIKYMIPYFISEFLLIGLRMFLFRPPSKGSYQLNIGLSTIQNLKAYIMWSFNFPEEIKAQFVNFFKLNSQFADIFKMELTIYLVTSILLILLFYILPFFIYFRFRKNLKLNMVFFGFIWFVIGLLPVLFLPEHSFTYYLPVSLVGLFIASMELFSIYLKEISKRGKILVWISVSLITISWIISAFTTIKFNSLIHWAPRRAQFAEIIIGKAKKLYPVPNPDYPYIYVKPDSEIKHALNDQDGFKIIYGDSKIITVYKNVNQKNLLGIGD